ncbi:ABC transporter substrate-binding protein [Cereibacter changlensis JA139]|uniref:ABC transporter substrate-binding protein n=2 Tax=Cereibacter changlensis TaxID=402884 RepID=A0A2T4JQG2_9RHOB|nr:ABC transporter substrate-binding protein [Cereibacter changlensis]PTE20007.1 ABC transporter substrate-binding protein [Cereibacter changlensis JA139]PZX57115.1 putative thiamine transport system substrate-binding protein [Cereibacter changlensis]
MKTGLLATVAALLLGTAAPAQSPDPSWQAVLDAAEGQTVYWHAWGGDPKINAFIDWVGEQAMARHGVTLEQVKLSDTSEAVARVLGEQQAGRTTGGAVDLIWINGENFLAMKRQGLLSGPFAEALPNWPLVDVAGKPAVVTDFTEPTEGRESPWAMAQLVFEYDSARLPEPPRDAAALLDWIKANPGRFTYPQPPDYLGATFLKQVLHDTMADPALLQQPVDPETYAEVTAPLWAWLDAATPHLWREGRAYPQNEPALGQLLADGETLISFALNPGRASAVIAAGELPETVRTFVFVGGTIGNASFVAIPFNAAHEAGAKVVANLLLDPEVQARAQDPAVLGFQTVLDVAALPEADRARFDALELGAATLPPAELGEALLEPHASWMEAVTEDWLRRYGVAQ